MILPRRALAALAVCVLVLLAAGTIAYHALDRLATTLEQVVRAQEIALALERVLSTAKDAQRGSRGYVLTGDPSFLAPFERARDSADLQIERLTAVAEFPGNGRRLDSVRAALNAQLAVMTDLVELRRNRGAEAAESSVAAGEGKRLTDELHRMVGELLANVGSTLEVRQAAATAEGRRAIVILLVATLLAALAGALAVSQLHRTVEGHESRAAEATAGQARAEESLRLTADRLQAVVDASPVAITALDEKGSVLVWSRAAEQMFGWRADEVIGRPLPVVPADKAAEYRGLLTDVLEGRSFNNVISERVSRDGRRLDVSISTAALHGPSGERVGVTAIYLDVTEQRLLEEQFREAQKMESVGRLAGGIAHDFNNLLTAIRGFADLAAFDLPERAAARNDIAEIRTAADRAAMLTRQLLTFSRRQVVIPQPVDVAALLAEMETLLQRLVGEPVRIAVVPPRGASAVRADPTQLQQVLLNLVVNAKDALPRGGRVLLEVAQVDLDAAEVSEALGMSPGRYVMLAVSDNGHGIDRETMKRIFEPFFTTKEPGRGTGLGLSTVHGIVRQSGGDVRVYSEPGVGTTFKVYLPLLEEEVEAVPATTSPARPDRVRGGDETILLVEDEPGVLAFARQLLERNGYRLLTCRTGREALERSDDHQGTIDLVLTDIGLPDVNGLELVDAVRRTRPGTKTLLMSGYTENAALLQGMIDAPLASFLEKPFGAEALLLRVRRVLDVAVSEDAASRRAEGPKSG